MTMLTLLAVGSGTGLAVVLATPDRPRTVDPTRSLTVPEARRLASMRVANYRDARAAVSASIGRPGGQIQLAGWVDWSRGLTYLRVTGPAAGPDAGLLQAVPGVVAHRPDVPSGGPRSAGTPSGGARSADPPSADPRSADPPSGLPAVGLDTAAVPQPPPADPPPDGWRVRPLVPDGRRVDALLALLFGIAADRPDPVEPLTRGTARWLGRGLAGDVAVDIMLGPAPAAAPDPTADPVTAGPGTANRPPSGPHTSHRPTSGQPTSGQPPSGQPPSGQPTANRPTPDQPTPDQPTPGQPTPGQASPDRSTTDRPTSGPAASTGFGGTVRYWLDGDARLHRLETRLSGDVPVEVDLDRDAAPDLAAVPALGGRPVRPRAVTDAEAARLAQMPAADQARGGATVTLTLPTLPAANLRGAGLLDWRARVGYLSVRDLDGSTDATLVRADRNGIATRAAPAGAGPGVRRSGRDGPDPRGPDSGTPGGDDPDGLPAMPPVPPPTDRSWDWAAWGQRPAGGAADLDLMLSEALSVGSGAGGADRLRSAAVWLRADRVGGRQVAVFEIPKPAEAGVPAGEARFRYWVDDAGLLRRLELRTRSGAYAQLDLSPGRVPRIAAVPVD